MDSAQQIGPPLFQMNQKQLIPPLLIGSLNNIPSNVGDFMSHQLRTAEILGKTTDDGQQIYPRTITNSITTNQQQQSMEAQFPWSATTLREI
jgi:hypothetical protein